MIAFERRPLLRFLLVAATLLLLLAGCQTAPPPTPATTIDLEGLWLVTPGPGTSYGSGGTTTLEFGAAPSGTATYLSQSAANDVTACERHVYAALSRNVVLLDGDFYVADAVNANRIVLDNDTDSVTLDRVVGAAPVAPCAEATATLIKLLAEGLGPFTNLNAVGANLYFNTDAPGDPIVAYDTTSGTLGAPRAYSDTVAGGTHRWVVGARTDDLFYGHCGCGGSASLDYMNLGSDTSIAYVDTGAGLGVSMTVRYGYYDASYIVIGGRDHTDQGLNDLLTLNRDTLSLVSSRTILDGANIRDVTLLGADLLALVGDGIVVVGADGRAERTIELNGIASDSPRGITTIGPTVYVLDETAQGDAVLYEVAMP